jgi:hypothetical protein
MFTPLNSQTIELRQRLFLWSQTYLFNSNMALMKLKKSVTGASIPIFIIVNEANRLDNETEHLFGDGNRNY